MILISMNLPDYKGGSIVNLMASIKKAFNGRHPYSELNLLPGCKLEGSKNIIVLTLDGLGSTFIKKHGANTVFQRYKKGDITSVFPPTTGSAITTFLTGLPAQQSAIPGWNIFLKELGAVTTILRFKPLVGSSFEGIRIEDLLPCKGFTQDLNVNSYMIHPKEIMKSEFTKALGGKAEIKGYSKLNGLCKQINNSVKSNEQKKFIYAYWDGFDKIAHKYGVSSEESLNHFFQISKEIEKLINKLGGTNSKLIITADHGFIDTPRSRVIELDDHPELQDCLVLPFCGDARTIYCYVKPNKIKKFENYVKTHLNKFCDLYRSHDLIKKKAFGLYSPNKKLIERIGDYVLIMKENYVFKDRPLGSIKKNKIGRHSGLTKEEMLVPLIYIETN